MIHRLKEWIEYKTHKIDPDNFTIVMTILVKDEEDVIEQNIRTHAYLGVDAFVVMDNKSTDKTPEILERLSSEFTIKVIRNDSLKFEQGMWMTRLAKIAKKEFRADWVISNDADEFWIPKNGLSLREYLKSKHSVLRVKRFNMVYIKGLNSIYESNYRINFPIFYTANDILTEPNVPISMGKIGPKVIVNPHGLIRIRGGNHSARHIDFARSKKGKDLADIYVCHYNVRSYEQLLGKAEKFSLLLNENGKVKLGNHCRRWGKIVSENKFPQEFEKLIISRDEIPTLERLGVIVKDDLPATILKMAHAGRSLVT